MNTGSSLEADTVLLEFCDNVTMMAVRAPGRRRVLTRESVKQRVIPRPYRTWIVSEAENGCATAGPALRRLTNRGKCVMESDWTCKKEKRSVEKLEYGLAS